MKNIISVRNVLIVVAIFFAMTPFYGIAYMIALYFAVRIIRFSKTFSTIFGRIILSFLLLAATIMFTGMVSWIAHIQTYALLVIALFALLLALLNHYQTDNVASSKFMDRGDIVSLGLALVGPIIILASFYLPKPSNAATYQFLSTGWDNAWHINILQNDSTANGYVYFKATTDDHNSKERFSSYPQGWHIATFNITNGFGAQPFNSKHPLTVMNVYAVIYILWFMIAAYCVSRLSWRLLQSLLPKIVPSAWLSISLFAMANLLVQSVVFYGSLAHGFPNYLACIAYLALLAAMVIDKDNQNGSAHYITSLAIGAAIVLSWVAPLPAVGITILLAFKRDGKRWYWPFSKPSRKTLPIYLITLAAGLAALAQIAILILYTSPTKNGVVNMGSIDGTFPVSQSLAVIIAVVALYYWVQVKSFSNKAVAIIGPTIILAVAIYIYQMFTTGTVSYYLGKSLGLVIVMAGIFFAPAFVSILTSLRKPNLTEFSIAILGICIIGLAIVGTNQSTVGFNHLFQRNSKVTLQVATKVVHYLKSSDLDNTKLIILRHQNRSEDNNGNLVGKLPNLSYTCAYYIESYQSINNQMKSLDKCAKTLDKQIVVITSNLTKDRVLSLHRDNIRVINVR